MAAKYHRTGMRSFRFSSVKVGLKNILYFTWVPYENKQLIFLQRDPRENVDIKEYTRINLKLSITNSLLTKEKLYIIELRKFFLFPCHTLS